MQQSSFILKQIGVVHSEIEGKTYTNWDKVISEIHLEQAFQEGLYKLDQYSHAIIVFFMDQFDSHASHQMIKRPRDREDMPETGVFAQRTKYRPNPIGISVVSIEGIQDNILIVKGLDANNNSPVLDIKPYITEFDTRKNVEVPKWMKTLMENYY
ncbi:tRNA (N6-threonylcarbamoyladenosine(37)-N6)-methyltransferase TrmO [Amphibacillus cookii]|uniref:tRNA (N6-threonylcarbamoyladenosine(37)-N6)-methyltransferase TrmO n=1 Tax=Amphibacillus cookii TaxID=767787 RepID=UPI001956D3C3|nr:tRNA (N6-threonylcarbamoyladenosine(37)-N6)-methyltransferase TrmO [Amphibacillus cookii]MBM7541305.1 tRNA-Thr(GGU) m(6)t(6)A37 methyltransferase TsaA [Amphibacillus cookii]